MKFQGKNQDETPRTYVLKNIKIIEDTVFIKRNLRGFTTHLSYAAVFKDFSSAHAYKKLWKLRDFEPCVTVMQPNIYYSYGEYKSQFNEKDLFSFNLG